VRHDVAIEINGRSRVPEPDIARRFANRGVTFSFGSDGHAPEEVGGLTYPHSTWAELGLPMARLLSAPAS